MSGIDPDDPEMAARQNAYRRTQKAADMLDAAAQDLGYDDAFDIEALTDLPDADSAALNAIVTAQRQLRSGDCRGLIDRFEGGDTDE